MPTNLPPEYFEVDRQFRAATSPEEKIALLEELISTVPKHKGTDHLRADLRRRLSKMKEAAQGRRRTGRSTSPYQIDIEGAGQVILVGTTNVGKSSLVTALTNASPEVSDAPFTTWAPTPGMMLVDNVQVQLIDTPPLNEDYVDPEMMNLVRRCDLVLLVVDMQTDPLRQLEDAVALLEENRILAPHRADRYEGLRKPAVKRFLVLANKYDDDGSEELFEIFCALLEEDWPMVAVSAVTGRNLEHLKWVIFEQLGIMRIYSKPPGQEPNRDSPFVMEKGGTVEEFARKIHLDFYENLKSARVWGKGVFDGQLVGRDHVLHDEDVVELRI
jgi:ribosome-interacting GTPase 1